MTLDIEKEINENQNLIYSISKNFLGCADTDDLFQAGVIGLIKASKNFNPSLGVKFTTFAYNYIFGEMRQYVDGNHGIKISREITKLNLKIEKLSILLAQKLMREPTIQELALYLELPEEVIIEARLSNNLLQSIDDDFGNEDINLHDVIPDKHVVDIDSHIDLMNSINSLNEDEKELIRMRYFEDMTQSEVAEKLGMNQVGVSRRESKVLTKMRNGL